MRPLTLIPSFEAGLTVTLCSRVQKKCPATADTTGAEPPPGICGRPLAAADSVAACNRKDAAALTARPGEIAGSISKGSEPACKTNPPPPSVKVKDSEISVRREREAACEA